MSRECCYGLGNKSSEFRKIDNACEFGSKTGGAGRRHYGILEFKAVGMSWRELDDQRTVVWQGGGIVYSHILRVSYSL